MKTLLLCFALLGFGLRLATAPATSTGKSARGPATVIYLVRHAEKVITDPNAPDPDLSLAGYARAQALQQYLRGIPIAAFFASPYQRTRRTLAPLAAGREILTYETHDAGAVRDWILKEYAGKTVLVAGHSNTVLELIETWGAARPVPAIADTKYDYIFKITVRPGKKAKVETATYGAPTR